MAYIWVAIVAFSLVYGCLSGNAAAVSAAMLEGAGAAVSLCVSIAGAVCLWSGIMELLRRTGITEALSRLFAPLLRRLFPRGFADDECAGALSANFSANLLGLGNAATPAGIKAARRLLAIGGGERELSRLVVLNTASVQLIPSTVAAVRSAYGAADAFDILPCVWLSSLASVAAGLLAERLLEGRRR